MKLYLWRDHLLTRKQIKEILSEEEYKEYFSLKNTNKTAPKEGLSLEHYDC